MNAIRTIAGIATLALLPTLHAQQGPEALSGPKAIIVFVGDDAPRMEGPVTGYRIERRVGDQEGYKAVAELKPAADAKALRKAVEQATKLFPYPVDMATLPVDTLFKLVTTHGKRSHLGAYTVHTPVLLGAGLAWADTDVKAGTRYQYRVVESASGNARTTAPVVHAPGATTVSFKPINARFAENDGRMDLLWLPDEGQRPATLRLHRSENDGPFTEVPATLELMRFGDTLIYALADSDVRRYQVYSYALRTFDMAGNAGPLNDTLNCAALDPVQMPMPTSLSAVGDSSGRGIRIDWVLPNAPLVKQLTLYRSTNSVDGFEPVAVLTPQRGSYLDEEGAPARSYFYHFVLEYKTQDRTMRTHSFASVVYDPTAPMIPGWLRAEAGPDGITLKWTNQGDHILGFVVHRGLEGEGMRQASSAIPGQGVGDYTWTDTATVAGRTHRYVVQAISTSQVHSQPSDTVECMPLAPPQPPPAPGGMVAQVDGDVAIVSWDDLSARGEAIAGYWLLRERGTRTDTLFTPVNFVIDTLPPSGNSRYRAVALSLHGTRSVPGPAATAARHMPPPPPPTGIIARNEGPRVVLTWEPALAEVARYEVYRSVPDAQAVKVGAVDARQEPRYVDNTPVPGQYNRYFLRAVSAAGVERSASRAAGVDR